MTVLLVIIYLTFISLGLPDSLLGSAWPSMYGGFGVPVSSAGIISMIIAGGTIISSLSSDRLIRRAGTGTITLVSVAMTAAALLGISFSGSFAAVCLWAIPLGLGAGSVDAALNNFVALHYKAAHMNWLHSFWGVGASAGPVILSFFLGRTGSWTSGYRVISIIQCFLVAVLAVSFPLWKKVQAQTAPDTEEATRGHASFRITELLKLPGAKPTLISFLCYGALESTVGLWGSTYLKFIRNIPAETAAGWISLYYIGITLGRFLSGFLALKLSSRRMIRLGQMCIGLGIFCVMLPLPGIAAMAGLFMIGIGCAPIFPNLLHETPKTFDRKYSQSIMGMQMACSYTGTTFLPPLFGLLGSVTGYNLFPYYLGVLLIVMVLMVGMIFRSGKMKMRAGV